MPLAYNQKKQLPRQLKTIKRRIKCLEEDGNGAEVIRLKAKQLRVDKKLKDDFG